MTDILDKSFKVTKELYLYEICPDCTILVVRSDASVVVMDTENNVINSFSSLKEYRNRNKLNQETFDQIYEVGADTYYTGLSEILKQEFPDHTEVRIAQH
jgi:folate-dependent phosphoribosylglycinamide formyltransferase PurN